MKGLDYFQAFFTLSHPPLLPFVSMEPIRPINKPSLLTILYPSLDESVNRVVPLGAQMSRLFAAN